MKGKIRMIIGALFPFLKRWILIPLLAGLIGATITGRIINTVIGPPYYSICVVGPVGPISDDPPSKQILQGFSKMGQLPFINNVEVKAPSYDDQGDPILAKQIASRLARRNDTLMVIGHMYSTTSKEALLVYMHEADPPIPVILTTETNPYLLPHLETRYSPIFRLSPTDVEQAQTAAAFAIRQGAKSCWVVADTENRVYSNFLAREFIQQVHEKKSAQVLLWSSNLNIPLVEAIRALKIDWVFFAGSWQNALILVRQLKVMASNGKPLGIILSDWSADRRLIDQGGKDVEGVYVINPMPASTFNTGQFEKYGEDAFRVVKKLLELSDTKFEELAKREGGFWYRVRRILGLRRVQDARNVLAAVMQGAVNDGTIFELSGGDKCKFKADGKMEGALFHVWQVRNGKFVDVEH